MLTWLSTNSPFPPLEAALDEPDGLLAVGGDLSPVRLLDAYSRGIFPWYNEGDPILWWSPDPRMVLLPAELKISRSLRKRLRKREFEVSFDRCFSDVMRHCGAPRDGQSGTWINPAMVRAYTELHRLGHAHSVETWCGGALVGGLYGVAIGRVFFGESMFMRATDASKVAFAHLVRQIERWGFGLIDCQMQTAHLASLGALPIPRSEFKQRLAELIDYPNHANWQFDDDLFE